jgi:hypothetical protein
MSGIAPAADRVRDPIDYPTSQEIACATQGLIDAGLIITGVEVLPDRTMRFQTALAGRRRTAKLSKIEAHAARLAGIEEAKERGVYKGRTPTAMRRAPEVLALLAEGCPKNEIGPRVGIGRSSVFRILRAEKAGQSLAAAA